MTFSWFRDSLTSEQGRVLVVLSTTMSLNARDSRLYGSIGQYHLSTILVNPKGQLGNNTNTC